MHEKFGDESAAIDYDGWEGALVDLSRDRVFGNIRKGRGAVYGGGMSRTAVLDACDALKGA